MSGRLLAATVVTGHLAMVFVAFAEPGKSMAPADWFPAGVQSESTECEAATNRLVAESSDRDSVLLQQPDGQLIEILRGAPARSELLELTERRPERFRNVASALEARGYRATAEVTVFRTMTLSTAQDRYRVESLPLAVPAATTMRKRSGKVVFWSWNDGDDATWEGSMYVENFRTGEWLTVDGQADISNASYRGIWAELTGIGEEFDASLSGTRGTSSIRLVSEVLPAQCGPHCWYPIAQEYDDFFRCSAANCGGCAVGCALVGPGWPQCTGACCAGAVVACALAELI